MGGEAFSHSRKAAGDGLDVVPVVKSLSPQLDPPLDERPQEAIQVVLTYEAASLSTK